MVDTTEARLQADIEKSGHRLALVTYELPEDMRAEFKFALSSYVHAVVAKCRWRDKHPLQGFAQ